MASDIVTDMAEAYIAEGFDSESMRSVQAAGSLFSDVIADRMEELEAGS